MKSVKYILLVALLVLSQKLARASEEISFRFLASTTIISSLNYTPDVLEVKSKCKGFSITTLDEVTVSNVSTITTPANIMALYIKDKNKLNLKLDGVLTQGTLSMKPRFSDLEQLYTQWLTDVIQSPLLKSLYPLVVRNTFESKSGFDYQLKLTTKKKNMSYLYLSKADLSTSGNALADSSAKLKALTRFIHFLESDKRSMTELLNNKSNQPPFVYLDKDGLWQSHHPFHSVVWNPKTKGATYEYADLYSDVKDLWEVKKIMGDADLASFVNSAGDKSQVRMNFQSKKDFSGEVVDLNSSKRIKFSMSKGQFLVKK